MRIPSCPHPSRRFALGAVLAVVLAIGMAAHPAPARADSAGWTKVDLDGVQVNALDVDPTVPTTLFAGTNGVGVFRTTNGGASWQSVNPGLGNLNVNSVSIDPTNPTVVLAGTGRGALVGEPSAGVYRTTDRGDSWTTALGNSFSDTLARAPQNPEIVFAGGAGPISRSTDGGATWTRLTPAADGSILNSAITGVAVSPLDPNVVIAVGNTEGGTGQVFRSADGGLNWTLVVDGLAPVFDAAFSPRLPTGAVVLVGGQMGVLRSTDNGMNFDRVTVDGPSLEVRQIVFNPLNPTAVYAATNNGVYQSADDGATWGALGFNLGNLSVRSLAVDRASPQTLYAGTDDGVWSFVVTPAPPFSATQSLFFAEGSTQPPFDTWFLVQNPGSAPAHVRFTFEIQGGGTAVRAFSIDPTSRFSLYANQILPRVAFSTRIDADQPIRAERAMYVGFDGTDVTGIPGPGSSWLFAEGSTQSPFQTWLLLQNPNRVPATATITYFLLGGGAPRTQTLTLPPTSRTSVFVNQVLPNAAFSSRVDSDQPIVVERAMYRFPGNAAAADAGLNAAQPTFYFPNAKTSDGASPDSPVPFDSFLLLENPNPSSATATVTLFLDNGTPVTLTQQLVPNSRQSVFLNQILPNASFGIQVQATQPIIAERSMFFGQEPRGAMATPGSPDLATTWFLAEGSTQPPFTETIYILNPNPTAMAAHLDFELPGGQVIGRDVTVAATRSLAVLVNDVVPNRPVSARVTTSLPSVVERQMFFTKSGALGGTDALAVQ